MFGESESVMKGYDPSGSNVIRGTSEQQCVYLAHVLRAPLQLSAVQP
jgi:hypothetical protein